MRVIRARRSRFAEPRSSSMAAIIAAARRSAVARAGRGRGPAAARASRSRRGHGDGGVAVGRGQVDLDGRLQCARLDVRRVAVDAARDPSDLAVLEDPVVELAAPVGEVGVADEEARLGERGEERRAVDRDPALAGRGALDDRDAARLRGRARLRREGELERVEVDRRVGDLVGRRPAPAGERDPDPRLGRRCVAAPYGPRSWFVAT